MNNEVLAKDIQLVLQYYEKNKKFFEPITQRTPYFHMGATITDSVLQAGLNYQNVVYPRILKLLTTYRDFNSTCDFIILMQTIPLKKLLNWKNEQKLLRITELSWFFFNNRVENEVQLANWLNAAANITKLQGIKGVGPKTIDYLKMLSGNQAIAVDRHLFKFLEIAGVFIKSYQEANLLFSKVADILEISLYELDRKIWLYMTKNPISA